MALQHDPALMKARRQVGITALSHKAIHKFLEDMENAAHESGFTFPRHEEMQRRGVALRNRLETAEQIGGTDG
jgi:hypothetical protein